MSVLFVFVGVFNIGFVDVSLAQHLKNEVSPVIYSQRVSNQLRSAHQQQYSMSASRAGLLFFVGATASLISTQSSGQLMKRVSLHLPLLVLAYVLSTAAMAITGPMFPIPVTESLSMVVARQILFGLSVGPPIVGAIVMGKREALAANLPDDMATSAAICSFYGTVYAFG